jgi:ABC-type uncharacterized transport system ATPase component
MLELKNIYKTFNPGTINEKRALNGLNLKLNEGDFVTVIGGNGAGKSTMLNSVAGVYPVDSGTIKDRSLSTILMLQNFLNINVLHILDVCFRIQ